jgi:toxin ParE1/3/4
MYAEPAEEDLRQIFEYIADELLEPETAKAQVTRILNAVTALEEFPFRFRLVDRDNERRKGLRQLPVDNYVVFYIPVETSNTVIITRIMYSGRNLGKELDSTDSDA